MATSADQPRLTYPHARREKLVEEHHGVAVADPYRWLEDTANAETDAWVRAQHALTRQVLDGLAWKRVFRDRLRKVWSLEHCHTALLQAGRAFFFSNDGHQEQDTLHVLDAADAQPRLLLDPREFTGAEGAATISYAAASPDGTRLAYSLSFGGSDWQHWRIRDVDTGGDFDEVLRWSKFSAAAWTGDSAGFFYSRYDEPAPGAPAWAPDLHQKVYYHRVGEPQRADRLVYHDPAHAEQGVTVLTTEDGGYLMLFLWRGDDTSTAILTKDLSVPDAPVVGLLPDFDAAYTYIGCDGPLLWFQTDLDAPMGRVIAVDARSPGTIHSIVDEAEHAIQGAGMVGGKLYVVYLVDAASQVRVFDPQGTLLGELELPEPGTLEGLRSQPRETRTFYSFTSFMRPATIYKLNTETGASEVFFEPTRTFDPDELVVEQVHYPSADGTRVPMFICHRKDVTLDGRCPTFLTAYGGFGFAITPSFTPGPIAWMQLGGVFALANVRGGGEYGERWHQAGSRRNQRNSVDDLIAAAEWLHGNGYTCPEKLALGGMSNGGLLVSAVATRRPDLCACVIPVNGVMDLVRFHHFTIGWAWVFEYGSPDDPGDFPALHEASPLHAVTPGRDYPATLICTAARDDRVVPAHSYKFAAALQAAQAGDAPVLLRVDAETGHGPDARASEGLEDLSDRWAFAAHVLGMHLPDHE